MTDPSVGPRDASALCPAPDPKPHGPSRFAVPAGAVDTHAHVIGLPPDWPLVPNRSYTPPAAPPEAYLAMLDATGMTYGVLVQVSVHGTDNRLMVQTLRADPQRLRGVAVVALGRPDSEYRALKEAGVAGLRVNVLFGGGVSMDDLESYGALCREYGWHLQFLLDARELPQLAPRFARLPVPFVVDHMGHFPAAEGVGHPGFQTLLGMVRDGAWVKLSGAYRLSDAAPAYAEATPLARALLAAAPDRCVWGSDWPHVANWGAMPNVGDLLDLLADWAPDEATRHRVLVENPARLYGFPPVAG
ncbi:amidohydrolase family protein [Roseomonas sp. E05]|uniref:amidohydrolase family protein n=1 Tax=Roseomonas sp. E05 TaxID=3046310 RepID=UPI0024BA20C5|nr:amidohydrolase family protein [Roseomonas sp. E05]MDJ0386630.1 amidohydrolase family protein [Roseomonas sp. E05]